ncbi:MAG TPA: CRISPR system precrRNA processing endoribonuclease RAMP protein Cas6, partial [Bryobacteraceae bacterium]|nr:CRISPR system precrRNA processing endoribonuclease RAMP protein Cas6 [Bryobacteraceae bacterium]
LADPPRPFVFRARRLDGVTAQPGDAFHFDLHVFTPDPQAHQAIAHAFEQAARSGFGPGRGRAAMHAPAAERIAIELDAAPASAARLRIDFLSPTELKQEGRIVERPEFATLFARVRDRIATLSALYGGASLPIDFAAIGARAAAVLMTACELRHAAIERRSSRTGQTHPLGGFTGWAEYEDVPGEFLPYLEAARWTGVGRQAVWGKGEIAVSHPE